MLNPKPAIITHSKPVQVIAITGGKGGIGKTNISINLGIALAKQSQKVLLLDADLGLANINVLLGLTPKKNLHHLLSGSCSLSDIQLEGPSGIKIIPGASGIKKMTELKTIDYTNIIRAFSCLTQEIDFLLIDTAAGVSSQVLNFLHSAHEIVIVVCNEPTSLTDSYALIKILNTEYGIFNFRIIVNMVNYLDEGYDVFMTLKNTAMHFLNINLQYVGSIPQDPLLRIAIKNCKAVINAFPNAKSSSAFREIANKIIDWPLPTCSEGRMSFFLERLIIPAPLVKGTTE